MSSALLIAFLTALAPTAYPIGLITLPTPFKSLPVPESILSFTPAF